MSRKVVPANELEFSDSNQPRDHSTALITAKQCK